MISDKLIDNLFLYMDKNYDIFLQSISTIGYVKHTDFPFFDKTAYTNQLMNKFILTSENSQFRPFFDKFNDENKKDLNGMSLNCAMITYPYIEMKKTYG